MPALETTIGLVAALCTTASYGPQLLKAWRTGSTGDLSIKMLATLFAGLSLWVLYGFLKGDLVLVLANLASLAMLAAIGLIKLREKRGSR
jgi:MtN3 and saliva related transmembrane protein